MNGNGKTGMMKTAGMVDNRLSLDPNQFPFLQDWEDGEEYPVTIDGNKFTAKQISAGEFELSSADAENAQEDAAPGEEAEPAGKYKNPAVSSLAAEED